MIRNYCLFLLLLLCFCISCEEAPEGVDEIDEVQDSDDMLLPIELILAGMEVCDVASIDTTDTQYVVHFDGRGCLYSEYKKYGDMEITLLKGNRWADKGAVVRITYLDYTNKRDVMRTDLKIASETILNGTEVITNLSGGDMLGFSEGTVSMLRRRYVGNGLEATYNGKPQKKKFNRVAIKEFVDDDELKMFTYGDTTFSDYGQVLEWGTNRYQKDFVLTIDAPMTKTFCNARWLLTEGEKTLHYQVRSDRHYFYGVDKKGEPDNTCTAYGYKVTWTNSEGFDQEVIYGYFSK